MNITANLYYFVRPDEKGGNNEAKKSIRPEEK
jgi:hypothetical protein